MKSEGGNTVTGIKKSRLSRLGGLRPPGVAWPLTAQNASAVGMTKAPAKKRTARAACAFRAKD
jgi:hypothetical protein